MSEVDSLRSVPDPLEILDQGLAGGFPLSVGARLNELETAPHTIRVGVYQTAADAAVASVGAILKHHPMGDVDLGERGRYRVFTSGEEDTHRIGVSRSSPPYTGEGAPDDHGPVVVELSVPLRPRITPAEGEGREHLQDGDLGEMLRVLQVLEALVSVKVEKEEKRVRVVGAITDMLSGKIRVQADPDAVYMQRN